MEPAGMHPQLPQTISVPAVDDTQPIDAVPAPVAAAPVPEAAPADTAGAAAAARLPDPRGGKGRSALAAAAASSKAQARGHTPLSSSKGSPVPAGVQASAAPAATPPPAPLAAGAAALAPAPAPASAAAPGAGSLLAAAAGAGLLAAAGGAAGPQFNMLPLHPPQHQQQQAVRRERQLWDSRSVAASHGPPGYTSGVAGVAAFNAAALKEALEAYEAAAAAAPVTAAGQGGSSRGAAGSVAGSVPGLEDAAPVGSSRSPVQGDGVVAGGSGTNKQSSPPDGHGSGPAAPSATSHTKPAAAVTLTGGAPAAVAAPAPAMTFPAMAAAGHSGPPPAAAAAAAAAATAEGLQPPYGPPAAAAAAAQPAPAVPAAAPFMLPAFQQQQPLARTVPFDAASGMFPGLSGVNPIAVQFMETCFDMVEEMGTVQLSLYSGKGKGGQGAVFEGEVQPGYSYSNHRLKALSEQPDPGQRRVAVKVLLRYSDLSERSAARWTDASWTALGQRSLSREVQAAQVCEEEDPEGYVLRVYAFGRVSISTGQGGEQILRPALLMEYAAGGTVQEQLEAHGGKLDRDPQQASQKVWVVAGRMLQGLRVASKARVVHRDGKPDNMLLTLPGDLSSAKLGDFGFAMLPYEEGTYGTTLVATPGYEAPEVVGQLLNNTKLDVWLLGCSLLEMLTGELPFYYGQFLPLFMRKDIRQGSELLRWGTPYSDPDNPDYNKVGRHMTQTERATLVKLLEPKPRQRIPLEKVGELPYFLHGPAGTAAP